MRLFSNNNIYWIFQNDNKQFKYIYNKWWKYSLYMIWYKYRLVRTQPYGATGEHSHWT